MKTHWIGSRVAVGLTLLLSCTSPIKVAAQGPGLSDKPLTNEDLSVYRAVLAGWFQEKDFSVNLSNRTSLPDSLEISSEAECAKHGSFARPGTYVHQFRQSDLSQLGSANIKLVDADAQRQQVSANDPSKALRDGKTVDDAVSAGFKHGLFTLGEIRFNKNHTRAVVSFSFVCGMLCGHGSTLLLEKVDGAWKIKKRCGGYES